MLRNLGYLEEERNEQIRKENEGTVANIRGLFL